MFIFIQALYGLKSAKASLSNFLNQKLDDMGLTSWHENTDVWMRLAVKYYGMEYYEYILLYIDDLLAVSINYF